MPLRSDARLCHEWRRLSSELGKNRRCRGTGHVVATIFLGIPQDLPEGCTKTDWEGLGPREVP